MKENAQPVFHRSYLLTTKRRKEEATEFHLSLMEKLVTKHTVRIHKLPQHQGDKGEVGIYIFRTL